MYLDKEIYERAGLVGKPYGVKGGRGSKPRWGKKLSVEFLFFPKMLIRQLYHTTFETQRCFVGRRDLTG
jgi:hypothetical protein